MTDDNKYHNGSEHYLKWRGIAHQPFLVKIENGQVQGFDVDLATGELKRDGKVEGWLS